MKTEYTCSRFTHAFTSDLTQRMAECRDGKGVDAEPALLEQLRQNCALAYHASQKPSYAFGHFLQNIDAMAQARPPKADLDDPSIDPETMAALLDAESAALDRETVLLCAQRSFLKVVQERQDVLQIPMTAQEAQYVQYLFQNWKSDFLASFKPSGL